MDRQPIGQLLLKAASQGRAESLLAVLVIALSLPSPLAAFSSILVEVIAALTIPLLLVRGPWATLPLFVVAIMMSSGFSNHLLISGLIICLAVELAIARGRTFIAGVITIQWLITAYYIDLPEALTIDAIPGIAFELALLGIAAGIGFLRLQITRQEKGRADNQQRVEQALRIGVTGYLQDNLARMLTEIVRRADSLELESDDPLSIRHTSRAIAKSGRTAIRDLHDLMDQLKETDLSGSSANNMWRIASLEDTINSAAGHLKTVGFDVHCSGIGSLKRADTPVESVFAVAITEITTNIIKHATPASTVTIVAEEGDTETTFDFRNEYQQNTAEALPELHTMPGANLGTGAGNLKERMEDIGGSAYISSTDSTWHVRITVPHKVASESL